MELSNKSLALLLVAAIVISLGGTFLSLNKLSQIIVLAPPRVTGRALTDAGQVNLTIEQNASCTVDTNVNFGSGQPQAIVIDTDTANSGGFNDCSANADTTCGGIIVNNTGNRLLNVTFSSTKNGSEFLGGTSLDNQFQYKIDDAEIENNACEDPGSSSYTNVPTTATKLCNILNYTTDRNTILMDFQVEIKPDTPPGTKTTTINVNCIDAGS